MRVYEIMRKISAGRLTIRLWVSADGPCEECEAHADEIALCAATLADEDDDPIVLAEKLADTLKSISAVEVVDDSGNGGLVYPEWP